MPIAARLRGLSQTRSIPGFHGIFIRLGLVRACRQSDRNSAFGLMAPKDWKVASGPRRERDVTTERLCQLPSCEWARATCFGGAKADSVIRRPSGEPRPPKPSRKSVDFRSANARLFQPSRATLDTVTTESSTQVVSIPKELGLAEWPAVRADRSVRSSPRSAGNTRPSRPRRARRWPACRESRGSRARPCRSVDRLC